MATKSTRNTAAVACSFPVETSVSTPKGAGIVRGYADGWFKVEVIGIDGVLSFRAKDLAPVTAERVPGVTPDPIDAPAPIDPTDLVPEHEDPNPPKAKRGKGNGSAKSSPKPKARRAPKPVAESRPCLCGCEGLVRTPGRFFLPGHDARFHGWMRRLAQGEEGLLSIIPAGAKKLMTLRDGIPTTDYDGSAWRLR